MSRSSDAADFVTGLHNFILSPETMRVVDSFARVGEGLLSGIVKLGAALEPHRDTLRRVAEMAEADDRLEKTGWLPHYTMPVEALKSAGSEAEVAAEIDQHYRDNWGAVSSAFRDQIGTYEIDDGAKDGFAEALDLHRAGFYRAVPRTLFPDIERVVCDALHDGKHRRISEQKELRARAVEVGLGDIKPGGLFALRLFEKLDEHVYATVDTPDQIAAAEADPVPNRHAAIHGLVAYRTAQSSINALIMADYIYQVMTALKRAEREEAADEP